MAELLLTTKQAYLVMLSFLDGLQHRTNADELAGVLGDMTINPHDDQPMDPALWHDWMKAVEEVMS